MFLWKLGNLNKLNSKQIVFESIKGKLLAEKVFRFYFKETILNEIQIKTYIKILDFFFCLLLSLKKPLPTLVRFCFSFGFYYYINHHFTF